MKTLKTLVITALLTTAFSAQACDDRYIECRNEKVKACIKQGFTPIIAHDDERTIGPFEKNKVVCLPLKQLYYENGKWVK